MRSHDLARALLARRDNDIQFIVPVSVGGTLDDPAEPEMHRIELSDHPGRSWTIPADRVVTYDSQDDFVNVRLGVVYAGELEDD